jgi:EAL domain-containing protein (putative c-di-GMP-specific phosphodiesterase class I)
VLDRIAEELDDGDVLARAGTTEVAVFGKVVGEEDAQARAERLLVAVRELSLEFAARLDARVGISVFPYDGATADEILNGSDIAMIAARAASLATRRFTGELRDLIHARFDLGNRLRRAIDRHEFVLHFQPQVSLGTGAVVGLEALVRWNDPDHGVIAPGDFLPLLSDLGLMRGLEGEVLREACAAASALRHDAGFTGRMAINVTAALLGEPGMVDLVQQALRTHRLPPEAIELELVEDASALDSDEAILNGEHLMGLGVRLAMDDFGTGYSSMSRLRTHHFDTLKIDRSFVAGLDDRRDRVMLDASLDMARELGITTIAEGVETVEQWEYLADHRCDAAQGYLIARAMPLRDVEVWLRDRRPDPGGVLSR